MDLFKSTLLIALFIIVPPSFLATASLYVKLGYKPSVPGAASPANGLKMLLGVGGTPDVTKPTDKNIKQIISIGEKIRGNLGDADLIVIKNM